MMLSELIAKLGEIYLYQGDVPVVHRCQCNLSWNVVRGGRGSTDALYESDELICTALDTGVTIQNA